MNAIRSILALAVGLAVFLVGLGVPRVALAEHPGGPPTLGLSAGTIAYGVVFAALAGLTTASLAGRRHLAHAAALAGLIAVLALVHPWIEPGAGARWLDVAAVLLMAPAAAFAGWARARVGGPRPGS